MKSREFQVFPAVFECIKQQMKSRELKISEMRMATHIPTRFRRSGTSHSAKKRAGRDLASAVAQNYFEKDVARSLSLYTYIYIYIYICVCVTTLIITTHRQRK